MDFVEVYENALPADACAELVRAFEASGAAVPGRVGGGVLPDLKDSRDIHISGRAEWREAENALNTAVFAGLLKYLRTYRYALIAPLMLQINAPDGTTRRITADDFDAMTDETLANLVRAVLRPGGINLQRYTAGQGGYPYWHCELYPRDPQCETLHRHVLWTIYLNDGFDAGETEFLHQGRKIVPKTGSLLIAPLMLQINAPDGSTRRITADDFDAMTDETLANLVRAVLRPGGINLQRYTAGQGGYPYWHCELYPRDPQCETLHRHVLWTIYLNDGFDAGETEFLHQGRKIVPKTGSLLIAPAAFTHTHRGNRPVGGDKYIATSWILFQRAEQIFGGA